MNDDNYFVDTNILVYAHDRQAGAKWKAARRCVIDLWNIKASPSLSIQVMQELFVNLIKKNQSQSAAKDIVLDYLEWNVITNDESLFLDAMSEQQRWKLSFWDALILAAARRSGARRLLSEDFNEGQDYDGIVVENPINW